MSERTTCEACDAPLDDLTAQLDGLCDACAEAIPSPGRAGPMVDVRTLPSGYTLSRQENGAGGYTYYSDEVGGGVFVWDTSLVSRATLLAALAEEDWQELLEQRAARKEQP